MKFENLPTEMISKILLNVDYNTFYQLRFTNRRLYKIAKDSIFKHQHSIDIIIEKDKRLFIALGSARREIKGTTNCSGSDCLSDKIKEIQEFLQVRTLTLIKCTIPHRTLYNLHTTGYPNQRFIETLEILGGKMEIDRYFTYSMISLRIRNLIIKDITPTFVIIYDTTFSFLKEYVQIEGKGKTHLPSWVTDRTLAAVVSERRKVFKIPGLKNRFTFKEVPNAIDIALAENYEVEWNLGFIPEKASMTYTAYDPSVNDPELILRILRESEVRNFHLEETTQKKGSFWRRNSQRIFKTVKIHRPMLTIEFCMEVPAY